MTNSPLTKTELAHAFTPDAPDDAPAVDGLGNPRFLSLTDLPVDDDPLYGIAARERDAEIDAYNHELAEWSDWLDRIRSYN